MKKKSASQSAFFNLRVLIGLFMVMIGVFLALLGSGAFSNVFAQATGSRSAQRSTTRQDAPGTQRPEVVQLVGPVPTTTDVRHLPYIPNEGEIEDRPLTRYPRGKGPAPPVARSPLLKRLTNNIFG